MLVPCVTTIPATLESSEKIWLMRFAKRNPIFDSQIRATDIEDLFDLHVGELLDLRNRVHEFLTED